MKKNKSFFLILFILMMMFLSGCFNKIEEKFYIEQIETVSINIGDSLKYNNITFESNNDILVFKDGTYYGNKTGSIIIKTSEGTYLIEVNDNITDIVIECSQRLIVGEATKIETTVYPLSKSQEVTFDCNSDILNIENDGTVHAIKSGVCNVTVISIADKSFKKELTFIVLDKEEEYYEKIIETIIKNLENEKHLNKDEDVIKPVIEKNINSLIGVSGYSEELKTSNFASGIVYKMNIVFLDGSKLDDVKEIQDYKNIKYFEYYALTNRHIVEGRTNLNVYLGNNKYENCEVVQYDDKIDLAVIKFKSTYYVQVATIGNSSSLDKGEFIISIGNGKGIEYFRTTNFGILSSNSRYISVDTDNDNVSDWDSEYLQHDASLNEGDSGGAILNLKGEIIGINTTKISDYKYNNMSFAIPINLAMNLAKTLEKGIKPERLILGVQIIDVSKYRLNKEYYLSQYPNIKIPDDLRYGFYITNITEGGFAYKANMQVGDIIIKFNDINLKYTYELRSELGKYLKDSGDKATVVVLRDGKEEVLNVTF